MTPTKYLLAAIILIYALVGILYATLTPPWQVPDEPAHYNFIRAVSQMWQLPELTQGCYNQAYLSQLTSQKFPANQPIDPICYEHYQPPLYYLVAAPLFKISVGNLIIVRLLSLLFGVVSLFFVYHTVRLFSPTSFLPLATTAFVAFIPMHLTMQAAANNDSLAEMLLIILIYLALHWLWRDAPHQKPLPLTIGLVLGLILLTKVTTYTSIPLLALIIVLADKRWSVRWQNALRAYLPALLIAAPFYMRNAFVYRNFDILGLARHDEVVVGQLRTITKITDVGWLTYLNDLARTTFHSFWGQFGWMAVPMDQRVYQALFLLQLIALLGLGLWVWQKSPQPDTNVIITNVTTMKQGLGVMVALLVLVLGIFIALNLSFVQFQGRYFFSGLIALGVFLNLGLQQAFQRDNIGYIIVLLSGFLVWLGFTGWQQSQLDKWGLLIGGLALVACITRLWLPPKATPWYVGAVYLGLMGLSIASVWWFIVPNL